MKGITINRKFVAALVASAALAAPMAGIAMTANAADTQTGIVVNAPEGQVIHGTLTAYRLGTYADIETDATTGKVKSVNVVGDTTTNKWAGNAIDSWNAAEGDSKNLDITKPNGYDNVGAIAQLNDAGYKTNGVAVDTTTATKRLAGVANKLTKVADKPTVAATINANGKQTVTLNVPDGLYLLVDSAGNPLIIGTKIGGKDMTKMALGTVTVKEANVVDKKVKTTVDADYTDDSTETVGRTIDVKLTDAIPNGAHAGGAVVYKLMDTPTDMDLVPSSIAVKVGNTDVTSKVKLYTTAGTVVKGDATLVAADGTTRTDPDLTVPKNGFVIDASSLLKDYAARQLTVTYKAKINGYITTKTAYNDITTNTTWQDGTDTHLTHQSDRSTVKYYDLTLHKTAQDDTTRKVNGAGFKIRDERRGAWLKMDFATGNWSDATNETSATEFFTGDTNHDGKVTSADDTAQQGVIQFKGLSAGTYTIKETTAPVGFRAEDFSMPTLKAVISRDGTIKVTGDRLPTLTVDNGNGDFTVKDIDSLLQLPQTGGVWTIGTYLAAATLVGILAAGTASYAGKRRQQAGKPVVAD